MLPNKIGKSKCDNTKFLPTKVIENIVVSKVSDIEALAAILLDLCHCAFFFTEFSKKDITYVFLLFFPFLKNTHLFGSDIFCHLYHRIFGGNYKVHSIKRMKKKCENQKLTYFLWIQTFVVFKYSKSENKHYFQETRKTFFVTQ